MERTKIELEANQSIAVTCKFIPPPTTGTAHARLKKDKTLREKLELDILCPHCKKEFHLQRRFENVANIESCNGCEQAIWIDVRTRLYAEGTTQVTVHSRLTETDHKYLDWFRENCPLDPKEG